jgi:hypothetical protein
MFFRGAPFNGINAGAQCMQRNTDTGKGALWKRSASIDLYQFPITLTDQDARTLYCTAPRTLREPYRAAITSKKIALREKRIGQR